MGNASSAAAQASLQVVAALSGAAPLPLDAAEWQLLLGYAAPLSRFEPSEVELAITPHCAELGARMAGTDAPFASSAPLRHIAPVAAPLTAASPIFAAPATCSQCTTTARR